MMTEDEFSRGIREMFAGIARGYDRANGILSLGLHGSWRRAAARHALVRKGDRVLDLCSGTGDMAYRALAGTGEKGLVVGLDFCEPMIVKAGEKYPSGPGRNIMFLTGDVLHIPFADEFFDCATMAFGLRNIGDREGALREAGRVLKRGGRLMILEFTRPSGGVLPFFHNLYLTILLPFIGGLVTGRADAYRYLAGSIAAFPSVDELSALKHKAGFRVISAIPLCRGIATIVVSRK